MSYKLVLPPALAVVGVHSAYGQADLRRQWMIVRLTKFCTPSSLAYLRPMQYEQRGYEAKRKKAA